LVRILFLPLVIVDNFYVKSISVPPNETHTVLIVDSNAMQSLTICSKRLQSVSRRDSQVIERHSRMQNGEFLKSPAVKIKR